MKRILRLLTFTLVSLYTVQLIVNGFDYGDSPTRTFLLISLALFLLNVFTPPILALISLPSKGIGLLLLTFVMNLIILYVLTMFIPDFSLVSSQLPNLNISGFMLPFYSLETTLEPIWSVLISALLFSLFMGFLNWLTAKK